jgi:hypothetical protein
VKCWICGAPATTGEHWIKASDLRSVFGTCSQLIPLYFHAPHKRNIPVGSIKADRLKFKGRICHRCNTTVTQPHDKAWEKLSSYLQKKIASDSKTVIIDLSKPFPGATKKELLNVHLYFVKLFGCHITEHSIPIDIAPFSKAILTNSAHGNVFLAFGNSVNVTNRKIAGMTPIQAIEKNGSPVFAAWFYIVGNVAIEILFAIDHRLIPRNLNAIHPSDPSKSLRLTKFKGGTDQIVL